MKRRAFTLIELVIVITLISLLTIIGMMSWRQQIAKARDAQRKADLQKISIAFEEYFSDNGCYPAADILTNCGGDELKPYLNKIPCDPITREPYQYITDDANPSCYKNYRLLANLGNATDPAIAALGCDAPVGCGYDGAYNFGISSNNVPVTSGVVASPTPSASPAPSASPTPSASPGGPTPSASPKWYYCQDFGNCTEVPVNRTCNPAYANPNCNDPTNPCGNIISTCN